MAKCRHDFNEFKKAYTSAAIAWEHSECALCSLLILEDTIREYSRGLGNAVIQFQEFRQELIEIADALWKFNSSITLTEFDKVETDKQWLSSTNSSDRLVQYFTKAVSFGKVILEESVVPNAITRGRTRYRLSAKPTQKISNEQLDAAGLRESDEQLKQQAMQLRNVIGVNPCRSFEWLPRV
ncbi:MAG: hypothetical protein AB1631_18595 [Acidobacteriota bacterium]